MSFLAPFLGYFFGYGPSYHPLREVTRDLWGSLVVFGFLAAETICVSFAVSRIVGKPRSAWVWAAALGSPAGWVVGRFLVALAESG